MLNNKNKLFFPKIEYVKSIQINDQKDVINLYKLDWSRKEKKCNNSTKDIIDALDFTVKDLIFALSDGELSEIRRCSWQSIYEYNQHRDLNNIPQSIYLLSTISLIESAFKILAKNIYNEESNEFHKKYDKIIFPYLLLYKFWKNQTNNENLLTFANITELIAISINENLSEFQQDSINILMSFINEDLEENYE